MKRLNKDNRRGAVAVEAAVTLPLLIGLVFGIWEVGRMVQVNEILVNAAREGARVASGGYINGTPVTAAMVQQASRDYLTSSGLPAAACSGAVISLINQSGNNWTNPVDAQPLDAFDVRVEIPAGPAFESLRWVSASLVTDINSLSAQVRWRSMKNYPIAVNTSLPK